MTYRLSLIPCQHRLEDHYPGFGWKCSKHDPAQCTLNGSDWTNEAMNFGAVQRAIDEVIAAVGIDGEVVHANAYGRGTPPMNGYMMAFSKVKMARFEFKGAPEHLLFNPKVRF